jgi:Smr domain-containing protein
MPASVRLRVVNLEKGLPDRKEAYRRVETALTQARKDGVPVIKFIHGYGSSGVGGVLRFAVRSYLRQRKEKGEVVCFVNGEALSSFDELSKQLVQHAPELLVDSDWGAGNKGITLALLTG